jgi:hypothetical protein
LEKHSSSHTPKTKRKFLSKKTPLKNYLPKEEYPNEKSKNHGSGNYV